jgi:hypothetical protein
MSAFDETLRKLEDPPGRSLGSFCKRCIDDRTMRLKSVLPVTAMRPTLSASDVLDCGRGKAEKTTAICRPEF